jgi:hypothetical protein
MNYSGTFALRDTVNKITVLRKEAHQVSGPQ